MLYDQNFKLLEIIYCIVMYLQRHQGMVCEPKKESNLFLCAKTSMIVTKQILLLSDISAAADLSNGTNILHSQYTLCCLLCSKFDQDNGGRCVAFNFYKRERICELLMETPMSFYINDDCIYATTDRKIYNTKCRNATVVYNRRTFPDNATLTCPVYATFPAASAGINPAVLNFALGRPVYSQDASSLPGNAACNVVDGNRFSYSNSNSCYATVEKVGAPNWLMVDLQGLYQIRMVLAANRMEVNRDNQLDSFYVGVLTKYTFPTPVVRGNYPLCSQYAGNSSGIMYLRVDCDEPIVGRFVVIQTIETSLLLNLCEVTAFGRLIECTEVFDMFTEKTFPDQLSFSCPLSTGYPNDIANPVSVNIALGRPVTSNVQLNSSTMNSLCNAVDGDASGNFSLGHCVAVSNQPSALLWVTVDLQNSYRVSSVVISNRFHVNHDVVKNTTVYVLTNLDDGQPRLNDTTPRCGNSISISTMYRAKVKVNCRLLPVIGRFVVMTRMGELSFCEVEIYGTPNY